MTQKRQRVLELVDAITRARTSEEVRDLGDQLSEAVEDLQPTEEKVRAIVRDELAAYVRRQRAGARDS